MKIEKYNPGGKYHLSFCKRLHLRDYFTLARRSPEQQNDPAFVAADLGITYVEAREFLEKANGIRKFYAGSRPQERVVGSEHTKISAILGGNYDQLPRSIDDSEALVRDIFPTNIHFMSDLGLLSKQAATKLVERLNGIANLDQWSLDDLNKINLNRISQIGPVYALEIFRVLTAWGASPEMDLPLDPKQAEQLMRAGLQINAFDPKDICAIFKRSASPEVTKRAKSALKRAGVSGPAVAMTLDVLAI